MTPPLKLNETLFRIGWLGSLPENIRSSLLRVAEFRKYPPNSTIYRQEDPAGGIYGIADGYVDVLAAPGPFPMRLVHVAGVGWWAGEAALVSRSGTRAELKTRTKATVVYISGRNLERLAEQDLGIWRYIAALTVRNLDTTMLYAASFASTDLKLRLLTTLVRVIGPAIELGGTCRLPLGQAELAELSGLSRNTVSRLLSKLTDDGWLERHYGSVTVNVNRLSSFIRV